MRMLKIIIPIRIKKLHAVKNFGGEKALGYDLYRQMYDSCSVQDGLVIFFCFVLH